MEQNVIVIPYKVNDSEWCDLDNVGEELISLLSQKTLDALLDGIYYFCWCAL